MEIYRHDICKLQKFNSRYTYIRVEHTRSNNKIPEINSKKEIFHKAFSTYKKKIRFDRNNQYSFIERIYKKRCDNSQAACIYR